MSVMGKLNRRCLTSTNRSGPASLNRRCPGTTRAAKSAGADEVPDSELISAVRNGQLGAYADLFTKHRAAAYNLARQLTRSQAQADDLVSDAFAKVLET